MATKLEGRAARLFKGLVVNHLELDEAGTNVLESIEKFPEDFADAINVFRKVKFFDAPERYAVNGWGYDQSNYENILVVGTLGSCVICYLEDMDIVYSVRTVNYRNKKDWTKLDEHGVRCTNWQEAYGEEEIQDNELYNFVSGH